LGGLNPPTGTIHRVIFRKTETRVGLLGLNFMFWCGNKIYKYDDIR
jgi:hypothetical protein